MHPEHWYEISDWIPFEDNDSCWITSNITLEKSAADNMSLVGSMFVSYFDGNPVPEVSVTMLEPHTNLQRTTLLLLDSEIEIEASSENAWIKTDDMPASIAALRAGKQIEIRIEDLHYGEIHALVGTRGFQMALNAISRTCWFAKGTGAAEFEGRG